MSHWISNTTYLYHLESSPMTFSRVLMASNKKYIIYVWPPTLRCENDPAESTTKRYAPFFILLTKDWISAIDLVLLTNNSFMTNINVIRSALWMSSSLRVDGSRTSPCSYEHCNCCSSSFHCRRTEPSSESSTPLQSPMSCMHSCTCCLATGACNMAAEMPTSSDPLPDPGKYIFEFLAMRRSSWGCDRNIS